MCGGVVLDRVVAVGVVGVVVVVVVVVRVLVVAGVVVVVVGVVCVVVAEVDVIAVVVVVGLVLVIAVGAVVVVVMFGNRSEKLVTFSLGNTYAIERTLEQKTVLYTRRILPVVGSVLLGVWCRWCCCCCWWCWQCCCHSCLRRHRNCGFQTFPMHPPELSHCLRDVCPRPFYTARSFLVVSTIAISLIRLCLFKCLDVHRHAVMKSCILF